MKSSIDENTNMLFNFDSDKDSINFKMNVSDSNNKIEVKFDINAEEISKVDKKDVSSVIKMEDIGEDEQLALMGALQQNKAYVELMTDIMNLQLLFGAM